MPEFIRIFHVIFDSYTIVNFFYSILTLISIVMYVGVQLKCKAIVKQYPIWPNLSADDFDAANNARQLIIHQFMVDFEQVLNELQSYKNYVTLSIICAALKLFEYFDKSKNMRSLINVLHTIKLDLQNFMIIFFCLIFGF